MRHSTTEMIYAREQEALSHALSIILLLGFVILSIPAIFSERFRSIGWSFFILGQTLMWLRISTRRAPSTADRQPIWSNLASLHSEHWGER